jgi:chromosome segregation ATPase
MISLEQIQKLETRVIKTVELIKNLKAENQSLRQTLESAQKKMQELESLVGDFKSDQEEIEQCIVRALNNLNELEDEISDTSGGSGTEQQGSATKEAPEMEEEEDPNLPFGARDAGPAKSAESKSSDGSKELDIF